MRWHTIEREHEYRQAIIDRLDQIIALLAEMRKGPGVSGPSSTPSSLTCPECGREFDSERALKIHVAKAHRG